MFCNELVRRMRTALVMVLLLLLTGLLQHPEPTELDDEITVYSTDNYDPVADMMLGANQAIASNIAHTGTKNVAGQDWDVYRFTLDSTGQLNVEFDASNSGDPDATTGNGIDTYQWNIFFDAPYGDDQFNLEGHTFSEPASSNGLFTYSFQNVTVSEDGQTENQIRLELRVYDAVGKESEKFRMYFVVADEGSVDEEPVFQFDTSNNMTSTDSDVFYINGSLVSGSETGEVYVEVAFSMDSFGAPPLEKYTLSQEGLWAKTNALSDGDSFSLMLSIDGFYTNLSETLQIYFKTYEWSSSSGERWVNYHYFQVTLLACQGLVAPQDAISAGGEFILDEDGHCQWDGAWTYDSTTGQWEAPEVPIEVDYNSTLSITEVGPFLSSVDTYSIDGVSYPVLYLEESFHIDALLTEANGQAVGGKCLNIYLDPDENTTPFSTAQTDYVDGTIEWFSGDPLQNPTLLGVQATDDKLEGLRTLKVAYEPDINVPGGCDEDIENSLNGSEVVVQVLVRSRVDLLVLTGWNYGGEAGIPEGELVVVEVALLRDRHDLAIENEEIQIILQYRNETGAWVTSTTTPTTTLTDEQGIARFEWLFAGPSCDGVECTGEWRLTATYGGSQNFQETQNNITFAIDYKTADEIEDTPPLEENLPVDEIIDESVPGFEVWLFILAMLFAVSFRRKLNV